MYSYNVSLGELLDRYTILLVKQSRIKDEAKLAIVNTKLEELTKQIPPHKLTISSQINELEQIHSALWREEDEIRILAGKLPAEDVRDWVPFSRIAQRCADILEGYLISSNTIRKLNDRRHELIREIDQEAGDTPEPKEYADPADRKAKSWRDRLGPAGHSTARPPTS